MGELRKLEFIYAQHNDIVELPLCNGCEGLKEVYISNNFIKVDHRLFNLTSLPRKYQLN